MCIGDVFFLNTSDIFHFIIYFYSNFMEVYASYKMALADVEIDKQVYNADVPTKEITPDRSN